jgi:hypothetical protein
VTRTIYHPIYGYHRTKRIVMRDLIPLVHFPIYAIDSIFPHASTDTAVAIVPWGAMDNPDHFSQSVCQTSRKELLHNAVTMARMIGGVSPLVGSRASQVGVVARFFLEALAPATYSQHFDHCFRLGRPSRAAPTGEDPWFTTVAQHRCTHKVVDGGN